MGVFGKGREERLQELREASERHSELVRMKLENKELKEEVLPFLKALVEKVDALSLTVKEVKKSQPPMHTPSPSRFADSLTLIPPPVKGA